MCFSPRVFAIKSPPSPNKSPVKTSAIFLSDISPLTIAPWLVVRAFFLRSGFAFLCRQQINQIGRAIHRGLIGNIVSVIVVVNNIIALKICILIAVEDADTKLLFVDAAVNRPIDQRAKRLIAMQYVKGRMGVIRKITIRWKPNDHTGTPWVTAKQPVKSSLLQLPHRFHRH